MACQAILKYLTLNKISLMNRKSQIENLNICAGNPKRTCYDNSYGNKVTVAYDQGIESFNYIDARKKTIRNNYQDNDTTHQEIGVRSDENDLESIQNEYINDTRHQEILSVIDLRSESIIDLESIQNDNNTSLQKLFDQETVSITSTEYSVNNIIDPLAEARFNWQIKKDKLLTLFLFDANLRSAFTWLAL
jgi:hypothetical protein